MDIRLPDDKKWEDMIGKIVRVGDCMTSGCKSFLDYVDEAVRRNGYYDVHLHYTRLIQPTNVSNGWWIETNIKPWVSNQ